MRYKNCRNCNAAPDESLDKCSYCGTVKPFEPIPEPKQNPVSKHGYAGLPPVNMGGMSDKAVLLAIGGVAALAIASAIKSKREHSRKPTALRRLFKFIGIFLLIGYFLKRKKKQ